MHDQAVENWIFRIMRDSRERYPDYHWTFYCAYGSPGRLDDAVRELGGEVIHSAAPIGETRKFVSLLHNFIERGRYDVMHAHHDIVSAVYLIASARTPLRRRVVHVHNTAMDLPTPSTVKRAIVWEPMRRVVLSMADRIAGISRDALASMILNAEPRPGRDVVVYYGIDTSRFRQPRRTSAATREMIGVAPDAKVILFAGRMTEYKNPVFIVNMLEAVAKEVPEAVAVFAGTGPEAELVEARASELGIGDRIRVLGFRDDLAELMLASDVLVWPGQEVPKEGLGLGVVEGQAAGLPIIMSRSVPDDAIVVEELVTVLPLALGPEAWARKCIDVLSSPRMSRMAALSQIEASHFSLRAGTDNVMALYQNLSAR
jgi:glycosyltransferase involved in cell wall biosynthesis